MKKEIVSEVELNKKVILLKFYKKILSINIGISNLLKFVEICMNRIKMPEYTIFEYVVTYKNENEEKKLKLVFNCYREGNEEGILDAGIYLTGNEDDMKLIKDVILKTF